MIASLRSKFANPYVVMTLVTAIYIVKAIAKITIGTHINSPMIAGDGWHNVMDIIQACAVMGVLYIAQRPHSEDYPFGRKNLEFIASLAIGATLLVLAYNFAIRSFAGLLAFFPNADMAVRAHVSISIPRGEELVMNGQVFPWVVGVTLASAVISVFLGRFQRRVGIKAGHASLVAGGEETLSDARIEAVTLAGVLSEYLFHWPWLEYPLGLLIACLIARTGFSLLSDAVGALLQRSIGRTYEARIREISLEMHGVQGVTSLKTFASGRTAVVILTLTTARGSETMSFIKYGVEHSIRAYLQGEHFKDAEIYLKLEKPHPQRHRTACAVIRSGSSVIVAPSLSQATHLIVCDIEHGRTFRTKEEPLPAIDPILGAAPREARALSLLFDKRVAKLLVFPNASDVVPGKLARPNGGSIEICKATSFVPTVIGVADR